jgi:hypothetical protein
MTAAATKPGLRRRERAATMASKTRFWRRFMSPEKADLSLRSGRQQQADRSLQSGRQHKQIVRLNQDENLRNSNGHV